MKSIFKDFIYPVLILGGICLIVAFALSQTYKVTDPIIVAEQSRQDDLSRAEVLNGDASEFTEIELTQTSEDVLSVYQNKSGYAIQSSSKGFGGKIYVMVGIDPAGKLIGVKLTKHSETPGLGTKVGLEDFTGRFIEKTHADIEAVDTISGATVSSKAFKKAVDNAYIVFEQVAATSNKEKGGE